MGKLYKLFLIFAVLTLVAVLIPQVVLADAASPSQVYVAAFAYRNLLETNDFFLLIDYDIAYSGGYPTVSASNAFTFRLFDPTGSTEIADALPYVFTTSTTGFTGTNGYGMGVTAYYFDAASAPAWGDNYIIKVTGNPTELTYSSTNYEIPTSAYDTGSSAATDLASELRDIGTALSTQWNVPLLTDTSASSVFTADGESYFRNAVPGIQSLAPDIFEDVSQQNPDTTESSSYNTNLSNTYQHRFDNSWVHTSLAAGADLVHLPLSLFVGIFALAGCIFMVKKSNDRFQSPVFGYFGSILVLMGFGILFMGLTLLALVLFIGGFLLANALFFRKA